MSETLDRLKRFCLALNGEDRHGNGTCDICGRSGVATMRTSRPTATGIQRAELCYVCFSEDMEMQGRLSK